MVGGHHFQMLLPLNMVRFFTHVQPAVLSFGTIYMYAFTACLVRRIRGNNFTACKGQKDILHIPPGYRDATLDHTENITLYTDGSIHKNGSCNGTGGIGVYHTPNSNLNMSLSFLAETYTNQRAELLAAMAALESNKSATLLIKSVSEFVIRGQNISQPGKTQAGLHCVTQIW